jgi:DNA polymerase-3 subunit beta
LLERTVLLEALKRISILSSDRNKGIRMELTEGQLRIRSDNPDLGEAHEDLDVEYQGQQLTVGFDARYFMDLLNEMDEERVILELSGELDPGLVRPEDSHSYLGVVMPMRL